MALPDIPYSVTGNWEDPDLSLDTLAFIGETAKSVVKLPWQIGKGAGNIIKNVGELFEYIGESFWDLFKKDTKKNK